MDLAPAPAPAPAPSFDCQIMQIQSLLINLDNQVPGELLAYQSGTHAPH